MRYLPQLVTLLAVIASCVVRSTPPTPPTPEPPAQQVSAAAVAACANLRTLTCPEGRGAQDAGGDTCEVALTRRDDLHPLPLDCWAKAETVPIARGCGSLRCAL